ncbi:MAG: tripartite tricarboxylate transporter TctB family protein [Armatimonadota bacterium]|nr:tripartite tricarboxylate transporter TctB family protein [Armatimonadota bacterium]
MRTDRLQRQIQEAVFAAIFLVVGLGAMAQASPWPVKAALYPRVMAGVLVLACMACAVLAALGKGERPGSRVDLEFSDDLPPDLVRRRTLEACGWIGGFLATGWLVGLLPAMALLVLAYLRWVGRETWRFSLVATLVTWVALEGFMVRLLHLPIPTGVLASLIGR